MARVESKAALKKIEGSLSPESLRWYRQFPELRTRQGEELGRDLAAPKRPLWTFTVENTLWLISGSFAFGFTFNPLAFTVIIPILRNLKEIQEQGKKFSG